MHILINNAGTMLAKTVMSEDSVEISKREMDVNVLGMLAMCKAFAPVLARNGGGVIVNMLSVVSWYVYPFNSTYCATKHAALAVTDGLRIELKAQRTRVLGVYAGFIDTEMGASLSPGPKTSPHQVAKKTIEGILGALDSVLADEPAERAYGEPFDRTLRSSAPRCQVIWDERSAALDKENNGISATGPKAKWRHRDQRSQGRLMFGAALRVRRGYATRD